MDKLNFYTVDNDYIEFLKNAEQEKRGFTRVPNMAYGEQRKPKFLCGIVLQVNDVNYYVPVTSFKIQKPDNFLIKAKNGKIVSSLRFNYMFPVPETVLRVKSITEEEDPKYKILLSQELKFCNTNRENIKQLAQRTYKRVLRGFDKGLVINSCDFLLLEKKCKEFVISEQKEVAKQNSFSERIKQKQAAVAKREGRWQIERQNRKHLGISKPEGTER